jgi:hypothetical protein
VEPIQFDPIDRASLSLRRQAWQRNDKDDKPKQLYGANPPPLGTIADAMTLAEGRAKRVKERVKQGGDVAIA